VRTRGKAGIEATEVKARLERFLQADAKVPVGGKSLDLLKDTTVPEDPMQAGRVFYDAVNKHMTYAKDTPGWGNGDADWACKSGRGNCSDFHSLFIALARSRKIPAKFEMGFPLPEKRGAGDIPGYHCWAWFMPRDKAWVPVDISEANKNPKMADYYFGNLTADRIVLTTGRDIGLVPRQAGPPLNFFIYPYVEVDGKPYAAEKVNEKFSFKDLEK
jgi:transglutaminase-like putative cysteine protease